jgi:hypothetical protein
MLELTILLVGLSVRAGNLLAPAPLHDPNHTKACTAWFQVLQFLVAMAGYLHLCLVESRAQVFLYQLFN